MKSGPRVVIRYSSTYEKVIPDGSFRRRMEIHRTSPTSALRAWTPKDPLSSRDPKRRLLRPQKRLPVWRLLLQQRLREVVCERGGVGVRLHDPPHDEAARSCLRTFHTASEVEFSEVGKASW